jgi:hypothetical protein
MALPLLSLYSLKQSNKERKRDDRIGGNAFKQTLFTTKVDHRKSDMLLNNVPELRRENFAT